MKWNMLSFKITCLYLLHIFLFETQEQTKMLKTAKDVISP